MTITGTCLRNHDGGLAWWEWLLLHRDYEIMWATGHAFIFVMQQPAHVGAVK